MASNWDKSHSSNRRSFFRLLLSEAVEGLEKVGRDIVEKRLPKFEDDEPRYTPPPAVGQNRFLSPEFTIYGPPWPPTFGPYVTPELRKKLDADQAAKRESIGTPVARTS